MQTVEDAPIETIHLYVVREEEKKPYTLLPLLCAFACLLGIVAITLYSAAHPYYEHKRLTLPAQFLPLRVFTATAPLIPTGIYTYPAVCAHGVLTITNGTVISQTIPAGFSIDGVSTDYAVFVPAGSANGYGYTSVSAHAMNCGIGGNMPAYTINYTLGAGVYIRNLNAFHGGKDAYSVKVITTQDKKRAVEQARTTLIQASHIKAILASPCKESIVNQSNIIVRWNCQFVAFPHVTIPSARITKVTLQGKNLLVDVIFVARPRMIVFK